ncbi:MAG TPA: hypothetical protein VK988_04840 [Acidimicrobiales bacterium]|nr:hypothetical protein [Acidimicrobiales bacterium]
MGHVPDWMKREWPQLRSMDAALDYLEELGGNPSWKEHDGTWRLWGGDQLRFTADSREGLEGFVLGYVLATSAYERSRQSEQDPRPPGVYVTWGDAAPQGKEPGSKEWIPPGGVA